MLVAMGFLGFLALPITLCTGMLGIIVFTIVILRRKLRERRGRAQEGQPPTGGGGEPAPQS
jgi:hypothetical protein